MKWFAFIDLFTGRLIFKVKAENIGQANIALKEARSISGIWNPSIKIHFWCGDRVVELQAPKTCLHKSNTQTVP